MTQQLTLSALVKNRAGVLLRVAGLFARRGYNISSLTVCQTEDESFSRMTIVAQAQPEDFGQIEQQLLKLEDVVRVLHLDSGHTVSSELLLIKVHALNRDRPDTIRVVTEFGARIKDIGHRTITAELTGETQQIDEFVDAMSRFGIAEMSRTGIAALESGDVNIKGETF
ncbi:MAG: acetolactate synthase small subunit [Clostridiales bacterium]|nr:acetolactate synthase small subunit [Clostridiales bacterium]